MNLAAMIDLGVEPDYLKSELDKLGFGDEFDQVVADDVRNGIIGTRVDVQLNDHHHRNLSDIEKLISGSGLGEEIKDTSLKIFRMVAKAEASVHGKPIDEVHFHEVGATDQIVDKFIDTPVMITNETGYGIGHRETVIPNVLRVQLAATKQVGTV